MGDCGREALLEAHGSSRALSTACFIETLTGTVAAEIVDTC